MKAFAEYNPAVIFIYFASVTAVSMICVNPAIAAISLAGALALFFIRNGGAHLRSHFIYLPVFAVMAIINPLFYHNGVTVLFVLNGNPVTLEATLYGISSALMIISVIYWFRSFSQIMTSDKLLYLFARFSPKLALVLSMTLRYIPLFTKRAASVNRAQRALGLYKEDNAVDSIRGGTRVLSVMATWALENGIITADSMAARGYGTGRRTLYTPYRFDRRDIAFLIICTLLAAVSFYAVARGALEVRFYPSVQSLTTPETAAGYISYGIMAFLPFAAEAGDRIKWKYLRLKI